MGASSVISSIARPSPLLEEGGGAESSRLLIRAWLFWRPGPPGAHPDRVTKTKDTPITQQIPRNLGAL